MRILIATPVAGTQVYTNYVQSILETTLQAPNYGLTIDTYVMAGCSLLMKGRDTLVMFALENNYDAVLWIDSDIGWRFPDVLRLVASGHEFVGGLYPKKQLSDKALREAVDSGDPRLLAKSYDYVLNGTGKEDPVNEHFMARCNGLGCGFTLTRTSVYRKMIEAGVVQEYDFSYPGIKAKTAYNFFSALILDDKRYLSEDLSMCYRWVDLLGGDIWADYSVNLSHSGTFEFHGEPSTMFLGGPVRLTTNLVVKDGVANLETVSSAPTADGRSDWMDKIIAHGPVGGVTKEAPDEADKG